jgi:hypothetical protein
MTQLYAMHIHLHFLDIDFKWASQTKTTARRKKKIVVFSQDIMWTRLKLIVENGIEHEMLDGSEFNLRQQRKTLNAKKKISE